MPRGDNPNSRANLQKFGSEKDARKEGAKGGKASGEVRRQLKTFIELDQEHTTDEERDKMLAMLKKRALQGNLRAFELYANYMGLKPADKVQIAPIEAETVAEIEGLINGIDTESTADN